MRAWACGERRMRPVSMPGIAMSEPYIARPVTFGTPSGRIGRVPTHLKPVTISFTAHSFACLEPLARPPAKTIGLVLRVARRGRKHKPLEAAWGARGRARDRYSN